MLDGPVRQTWFSHVKKVADKSPGNHMTLVNAIDALETALSFYVAAGTPLPQPSPAAGRPTVRSAALECDKLGAYQATIKQRSKAPVRDSR